MRVNTPFLKSFIFNLQPSVSQQQFTSFNISHSPWLPAQNKTLLSPNKNFTAGFFPLPNSSNVFTFSIWYSKVPPSANPFVWNATVQVNTSGSLEITPKGELLLNGSPFQSAENATTNSTSNSTQLLLQNDGNLVFGEWSSFKNPTSTVLPNQNFSTGFELHSNNRKQRGYSCCYVY